LINNIFCVIIGSFAVYEEFSNLFFVTAVTKVAKPSKRIMGLVTCVTNSNKPLRKGEGFMLPEI
jgi:hypothetical protein